MKDEVLLDAKVMLLALAGSQVLAKHVETRYSIVKIVARINIALSEPDSPTAAKMIDVWVAGHSEPIPWATAVEILAIANKLPPEVRRQLLELDK